MIVTLLGTLLATVSCQPYRTVGRLPHYTGIRPKLTLLLLLLVAKDSRNHWMYVLTVRRKFHELRKVPSSIRCRNCCFCAWPRGQNDLGVTVIWHFSNVALLFLCARRPCGNNSTHHFIWVIGNAAYLIHGLLGAAASAILPTEAAAAATASGVVLT